MGKSRRCCQEGDRWIIERDDGKWVFLVGGCDYTGWDCQSWADSYVYDDLPTLLMEARDDHDEEPSSWGGSRATLDSVWGKMLRQLSVGRDETWRERVGRELNVDRLEVVKVSVE